MYLPDHSEAMPPEALGVTPLYMGRSRDDYLIQVESEAIVRGLRPDFARLRDLPVRGVIVTARAETAPLDFVSRFFAPGAGIDEDPVTGSAHCCLGPYWQKILGKNKLYAYQASEARWHVAGARRERPCLSARPGGDGAAGGTDGITISDERRMADSKVRFFISGVAEGTQGSAKSVAFAGRA